jgi:hypothetical protein
VGEARRDESTISAGGGPADPLALEQHDIEGRIFLLGQQRRPQAAEATTNDEQVAAEWLSQLGARLGSIWVIEPEGLRLGISKGLANTGSAYWDLG